MLKFFEVWSKTNKQNKNKFCILNAGIIIKVIYNLCVGS